MIAILGWLIISGILETVTIPLASLHKTQWYWVPAYASHFIMFICTFGLARYSKIQLPHFTFKPGNKVFFRIAFYFAAFGIAVGIYEPAINFPASQSAMLSTILWFIFQAGIVGWTEEFLYRGTLQAILNEALPNRTVLGTRVGVLLAAVMFSIVHLGNITYQSFRITVIQATGALVLGLFFGRYYDRTGDLAGAAWLHNIVDGLMFIVPLILTIRF